MQERIEIMHHHITNCLGLFLRDTSPKNVERVVKNKIIPSMEDIDIDDIPAYAFLKDPAKRQKYMEALTEAGIAFVTGNYYEIPDWDDEDRANFDIICKGCGNYDGKECALDAILDKETSDLPQDSTK